MPSCSPMVAYVSFRENVSYYSTLAHELSHWTATAGRCDRQLGKRFGVALDAELFSVVAAAAR